MSKFEVKGKIIEASTRKEALEKYKVLSQAADGIEMVVDWTVFNRMMDSIPKSISPDFNDAQKEALYDYLKEAGGKLDALEFFDNLFQDWAVYDSVEEAVEDMDAKTEKKLREDHTVIDCSDKSVLVSN